MIKVLSLGAGVQSTCMFHMSIRGEIENPEDKGQLNMFALAECEGMCGI